MAFKVTADTNNHNSCMAKLILPYNFNISETYCDKRNWYARRFNLMYVAVSY